MPQTCSLALLLSVVCFLPDLDAQESTIPVGVDGRDSLTILRRQDNEGNYDFGYNENQLTGGASFHRERGFANGTRTGSYGYTTRSGLIRIITYIADQYGYRAEVLSNEPGLLAIHPSNVTITKEQEPDLRPQTESPPAAAQQAPPSGDGNSQDNPSTSSVVYASASDTVRNYAAYRVQDSPYYKPQQRPADVENLNR